MDAFEKISSLVSYIIETDDSTIPIDEDDGTGGSGNPYCIIA